MGTTIEPIFYTTKETEGFLNTLESNIKECMGADADLLLDYPTIYIHVWQSKIDKLNGRYSLYIGEANDVIRRTKEHWAVAKITKENRKEGNWQYHMIEDKDEDDKYVIPTLYIFGHKLFHKSLTLDLENRLIDFCLAMPTAYMHNGRTNPQRNYLGDDVLDDIFAMIWKKLKRENEELFLSESLVKKSAIYKASPNHKLTSDQNNAKQQIIDKVIEAMINKKTGQLIMVEGEAGTGKTVLTSSTFYELLESKVLDEFDVNPFLLVNHEEQLNVYKHMAIKLGFKDEVVLNPTTFIRNHSEDNPVDITFIDESHLLWTQKKQAYNMGNNQLNDIMARSKITVMMFDEYQVLRKEQYIESEYLVQKRELAKSQNNYILLRNQLRMNCSNATMIWLDKFTKEMKITNLAPDTKGYEVKIFNTPEELHEAIKKKANKEDSSLSRLIASYDWPYVADKKPESPDQYWEVKIGSWQLPWNRELFNNLSLNRRQKMRLKSLDWAEQEHTINEVGSTFTIQGFDLAYAGVIIGPSVRYNKEKKIVWFDEEKKGYDKMKGNRTVSDGSTVNVSDILSQNELRVLLTRGTKGLYIYACDDDLRIALMNAIIF